jgi:hypothetical protein
MFDFDAMFDTALDSYKAFAILGLAFGKAKLYIEGDVKAHEVEEYLERHGVHSDCYPFSEGVVVALAGADEPRARVLLENWA